MAAPAIVGPLLAPLPTPIEALVSQWFHQDHPIENWDHYLERLVTMPVSDLWRSIDESKKKGGRFQWPYCRLERVDAVFRQMMPTFQLLYGPEEQEMFLREYSIQSRGQAYEQARVQMEARAQEGYELRKRRKVLLSKAPESKEELGRVRQQLEELQKKDWKSLSIDEKKAGEGASPARVGRALSLPALDV